MARILDPTAVHAIIATKWSGSSAGGIITRKVEAYTIETAIDSDADTWSVEIGNIDGQLNACLQRDNEVRVQIFGAGKGVAYLVTGIMDDANMTEQGTMELSGRDVSCIPVDCAHYPQVYRGLRPDQIIKKEAAELHMTGKFKLQPMPNSAKIERTDGSETYWNFWYRMIRKEGKWLWTAPDGTLTSSDLKNPPLKYRFGSKSVASGNKTFEPIQAYQFRKTTQKRYYEYAVHWRKNSADTNGQVTFAQDSTVADWYKAPLKIIEDSHVINEKEAIKLGNEEVYESKVGAIELVVTIADPGVMIETNTMAEVRIPEEGIGGQWFIVGTICRGDTGGFVQDVRLREKGFAVSKHTDPDPTDPDSGDTGGDTGPPGAGGASQKIKDRMGPHPEWWDCFVAAATAFHGIVDRDLFLATLLAIAEHETHFTNVRAHIGMDNKTPAPGDYFGEWYDWNQDPQGLSKTEWYRAFANEAGDGYVPVGFAVGPMQLGAESAKALADAKGGKSGDWFGGRWDACSNIWGGAEWLAGYVSRACFGTYSDACLRRALDGYGYSGFGDELWPKIQEWLDLIIEWEKYLEGPPSPTGYTFPVEGQSVDNFNDLGGPCVHVLKNGSRNWESNNAHDIGGSAGTKMLALLDGKITNISKNSDSNSPGGWAYAVTLAGSDGSEWWYGHVTGDPTGNTIKGLSISEGNIKAGDVIGYINRYDVHLHIGVHADGECNSATCAQPKYDPIRVMQGMS